MSPGGWTPHQASRQIRLLSRPLIPQSVAAQVVLTHSKDFFEGPKRFPATTEEMNRDIFRLEELLGKADLDLTPWADATRAAGTVLPLNLKSAPDGIEID